MPVTGVAVRRGSNVAGVALAIIAFLFFVGALDAALAQGTPFGVPRPKTPPPPPAPEGIVGWVMVKQAEFYRSLSGALRAAKADGAAVWALFGLSFLYGVFHAAGPGHGKAVISSYVVANEETWWRGVVLSFASALLQALVAVAIVGIAAVLLNATAATMRSAVYWIEVVSYALIIAIGLRLVWVKGRAMIAEFRATPKLIDAGAAATSAHRHDHAHHDHTHAHHDHHGHHAHGHDHHDDASAWGHAHAPEPQQLAGPGGWKRGLSAIVAVGLRPCSGAILVLVFSLAQGLFWAGVVSTFIMGLGTAITVAVIATIAVFGKSVLSKSLSSENSRVHVWAGRVIGVIAVALIVSFFAVIFGMPATWLWRLLLAAGAIAGGILVGWTVRYYPTGFFRGVEVGAALVIVAFGALLLTGYLVSERMFGV
jgi:nickel/cobalt exporter